jgi:hypothetical protein
MKPRYLLLALVPLFLAACGLSPQQKADYAQVDSSGVSPAIYDKMVHGDDLSVRDIEALSRARVSSAIILRYLRDQGSVYYISSSDVTGLQKAGVDQSVIDYMLQTARGGYWGPGAYPYYGFGYYDPFWYGPGFYGGGFYGGYYHGGGYHGGGGHYHH